MSFSFGFVLDNFQFQDLILFSLLYRFTWCQRKYGCEKEYSMIRLVLWLVQLKPFLILGKQNHPKLWDEGSWIRKGEKTKNKINNKEDASKEKQTKWEKIQLMKMTARIKWRWWDRWWSGEKKTTTKNSIIKSEVQIKINLMHICHQNRCSWISLHSCGAPNNWCSLASSSYKRSKFPTNKMCQQELNISRMSYGKNSRKKVCPIMQF